MNSSRILGCVGALTLIVAACNDKDVSLIYPTGGDGGSSGAGGSGAGSPGNGGEAGSATAGSSGAGGDAGSAGSAGMSGSAGSSAMDPDAGDSGTQTSPYAAICESYCAVRTAWATASGDAGVNCPGWDDPGCQAACELEMDGFSSCEEYATAVQCFIGANAWYCLEGTVYSNDCTNTAGAAGCDSTCDNEAAAVFACFM